MAISFTLTAANCKQDEEAEPPKKKTRLEVGPPGMNLHFANLIDEDLKDLYASEGNLLTKVSSWKPTCIFPAIDEDVLLYLAILGGKEFPSYMEYTSDTEVKKLSTKWIFSETRRFSTHENSNAVSNDYKSYENMVAHAIFCASRRNGVRGIEFDDFFACLLGEFQDELWEKKTLHGEDGKPIAASQLFEGYASGVFKRTIPFLAPPNAKWPRFIINANLDGCKFGHLVRAPNNERCDVYVQDLENVAEKAIFLCECKNWNNKVYIGTMEKIIEGLNAKWNQWDEELNQWKLWNVALVFCRSLANFRNPWTNTSIGCVKVDWKDGRVNWISQAKEDVRKQLIIVIETEPDQHI
jgi:hypothetical protein